MSWSYDPRDLGTDTHTGRMNAVRLLIGDTDPEDQQVTNSEVEFALEQNSNNIYQAAALNARTISAKYSRQVNQELDGAIKAQYSDLRVHYSALADSLEQQATKYNRLNLQAGGIKVSVVEAVEDREDRVKPKFKMGQFEEGSTDTGYEKSY